jgi:ADP-heptose:LPS heptosyltransferase
MRTAVFMSSGLGNSILLVPLLKELKSRGDEITILSASHYGGYEMISETNLADAIQQVTGGILKWIRVAIKNWGWFDHVYLDHFSSTRKFLYLSACISSNITAQKIPANIPKWIRNKLTIIEPVKGCHAAFQNLQMVTPGVQEDNIDESLLRLPLQNNSTTPDLPIDFTNPIIAIQIGSANSQSTYKNWAAENWARLTSQITSRAENPVVIILGDKSESDLAAYVKGTNRNIISVTGETSIKDAMYILKKCQLFIGVDSGLMHLAASLGTPTLTLWGPSDKNLYGWHKFNPGKHLIISKELKCSPCNSWLNPNTTRVDDPNKCPDYQCMKDITVEQVFEAFEQHWQHIQKGQP